VTKRAIRCDRNRLGNNVYSARGRTQARAKRAQRRPHRENKRKRIASAVSTNLSDSACNKQTRARTGNRAKSTAMLMLTRPPRTGRATTWECPCRLRPRARSAGTRCLHIGENPSQWFLAREPSCSAVQAIRQSASTAEPTAGRDSPASRTTMKPTARNIRFSLRSSK
jgi:hypothetical protein